MGLIFLHLSVQCNVKSVHHSEEEAETSLYANIRNVNKAGLASVMMITLLSSSCCYENISMLQCSGMIM